MDGEKNLTKKERRALRRAERLNDKTSPRKRGAKKYFIWASVLLVLAGGIYWTVGRPGNEAKVADIGESLADEGRNHVSIGTNVDYKTNPPASGTHWEAQSNWGVKNKQVPDEGAVHNLEHGGIWITYKPGIPQAAIDRLEKIVRERGSKVLLSPRPENDKDVAVVSWARYIKFDVSQDGSFDEQLVKDYINLYINRGPEFVPDSMPGKDY